jgi:hypothetical protein
VRERTRRLVASLSLLLVVPTCIALAYLGYEAGLYPYLAVPLALAALLAVSIALVFVVVSGD